MDSCQCYISLAVLAHCYYFYCYNVHLSEINLIRFDLNSGNMTYTEDNRDRQRKTEITSNLQLLH